MNRLAKFVDVKIGTSYSFPLRVSTSVAFRVARWIEMHVKGRDGIRIENGITFPAEKLYFFPFAYVQMGVPHMEIVSYVFIWRRVCGGWLLGQGETLLISKTTTKSWNAGGNVPNDEDCWVLCSSCELQINMARLAY